MHVEVRNTFDGRWVPGFELVGWEGPEEARLARLRRRDGSVVPAPVPADRVRQVAPPRSLSVTRTA